MDEAQCALREGRLVVFPTETVYGVGADALDEAAVHRIFAAKGRPADNPLIIHVGDVEAAKALCRQWPAAAEALAARFWPGPLTLVLPKAPHVPSITTGGLDTVAVRVPAHPVARRLLASGIAIAAPSANRSGRPSPTTCAHARAELGEGPVYVDGGPTDLGLESTVVDPLMPAVLRLGTIPEAAIAAIVGPLRAGEDHRSPGTRYRHYAPRARVEVVADPVSRAARLEGRVAIISRNGPGIALGDDPATWATRLYAVLRELEDHDVILVEEPPEGPEAAAVRDRLRRAAGP